MSAVAASSQTANTAPMTAHPVQRRKTLIEVAIPLEAINAASAVAQFFCSLSTEVQTAETAEDRSRLVAASIRLR